jgi:hypothetical protein
MKKRVAIFGALILLTILLVQSSHSFAGTPEDTIFAWQKLKPIKAAIVLGTLDGPDDILEKAEIIEDRMDLLTKEKSKLKNGITDGLAKLKTLDTQLEVLKDLAEIRQGGDFQTQQRLHHLSEQIQREKHLLELRKLSLSGLQKELDRLKRLHQEYRKKAQLLKMKERNVQ